MYTLPHKYWVFFSLCSDADHGTIRFIGPSGDVELINFYWSPELLQFGDQVDFRIGTRSYDQLVYATDLVVFEKAKDIRFKVSTQSKNTWAIIYSPV